MATSVPGGGVFRKSRYQPMHSRSYTPEALTLVYFCLSIIHSKLDVRQAISATSFRTGTGLIAADRQFHAAVASRQESGCYLSRLLKHTY